MTEALHRPSRVLVTGGAGFIGSNLVHRWLALDPALVIVNVDLMTYAASRDNLAGLGGLGGLGGDAVTAGRHQLVVADICDGAAMAALLRDHAIDTIVHLAAESHVDRSIDGPAAFVRTNVEGTCALLEAARSVWIG